MHMFVSNSLVTSFVRKQLFVFVGLLSGNDDSGKLSSRQFWQMLWRCCGGRAAVPPQLPRCIAYTDHAGLLLSCGQWSGDLRLTSLASLETSVGVAVSQRNSWQGGQVPAAISVTYRSKHSNSATSRSRVSRRAFDHRSRYMGRRLQ